MKRLLAVLVLFGAQTAMTGAHGQVVREDVEGIRNFAQIESVVACAGAIVPDSVAQIADMGFRSIINLQRATEETANVEEESAAAETAGIRYVHLPFGGPEYDPAVADQFLETIVEPETAPAFIHCGGGGRAASMWFIKRVMLDEWDVDTALAEAMDLGMNPDGGSGQFGLNYVAERTP